MNGSTFDELPTELGELFRVRGGRVNVDTGSLDLGLRVVSIDSDGPCRAGDRMRGWGHCEYQQADQGKFPVASHRLVLIFLYGAGSMKRMDSASKPYAISSAVVLDSFRPEAGIPAILGTVRVSRILLISHLAMRNTGISSLNQTA